MRAVQSLLLTGSLLLLAGCPQPPDTTNNAPGGPGAGTPPGPPPGQGSGGDAAGTPPAPAPAGAPPSAPDGEAPPEAPPADAAGTPDGGGCEWAGVEGQWSAYEGKEMVRFSGAVTYEGSAKGNVLVDFLNAERDVLLSARCQEAGRLDVQVPSDLGAVTVVVLIDADFNGPTRNDAVGRFGDVIEIKGEDIDGLSVSLVDGGDLGDITLPEPSGREAHPPVEGGLPPEEARGEGGQADAGPPPNPYKPD